MPKEEKIKNKNKRVMSDISVPFRLVNDSDSRIFNNDVSSSPADHRFFKSAEPRIVNDNPKIPVSHPYVSRWRFIIAAILFLTASVIFYVSIFVLPRVDIEATLTRKNIEFENLITVDKKIPIADLRTAIFPGVVLSQKNNFSRDFPASGRQKIADKAKGTIIIFNAYSSAPQILVANTRFLSPDNKIFRLKKIITVPGAKIIDGKISPSSITAEAVADEPGESYNIGPVSRFIIPGFKGTARYESFYAESKESMSGGFVGEAAVPTEQDLKSARAEIIKDLENVLRQRVLSQLPPGFKLITGASEFVVLKEEAIKKIAGIGGDVSLKNKFGFLVEAELKALIFKEDDLKRFFIDKAFGQFKESYEILNFNIEYLNAVKPDFIKGMMSFPVKATVAARRVVDIEDFRRRAAGQSELKLKTLIFAFPGLESAKITFWPFWVASAPRKIDRIQLRVL